MKNHNGQIVLSLVKAVVRILTAKLFFRRYQALILLFFEIVFFLFLKFHQNSQNKVES